MRGAREGPLPLPVPGPQDGPEGPGIRSGRRGGMGLDEGEPAPPRRTPHASRRQATPGSSLPSMNSREAPPPVEMWLILSA